MRGMFLWLSLFDSNAISFHKRLEVMRGDPRKWLEVLVIISIEKLLI